MSTLFPKDYATLVAEVKKRIRQAQYAALRTVNKELVGLYWDIGRMIAEKQTNAAYGAAIAEQLAADLQSEFPGVSGYSRRNIFYMREFYLAYRSLPKVQPLVAQIGWTHNLIVLQRCKDPLEREFYIRMTKKFGWSKNVLIHQDPAQGTQRPTPDPGGNYQPAGGSIVNTHPVQIVYNIYIELASLNEEAAELARKIQENFEESGV